MKPWRNLTISIGLVSVPVSIAPAFENGKLKGKRLCPNLHPVSQRWYCEVCGQSYETSETLLAYETSRGYVVPDKDLIQRESGIERSSIVKIDSFVKTADIDPAFYENSYLVWPRVGQSAEGFDVLSETLKATAKAAIGVATLTNKERMVAIRWSNLVEGLMFHVCRYLSDLRVTYIDKIAADKEQRKETIPQSHLRWGRSLVKALTDEFSPERYTDEYFENLLKHLAPTPIIKRERKQEVKYDFLEQIKATVESYRR